MSVVEGKCNFFVPRKKRFCRMSVRAGAIYCGEHEPKIESGDKVKQDDVRLRMACPLDPKHTCYISKLEKHLKVCNAKQGEQPPYIEKNCNVINENSVSILTEKSNECKRSLSKVSDEILSEVVAIVEKIYDEIISGNISTLKQHECHSAVSSDLNSAGRGDNTRRHLLQTSSLIHVLQDRGLVRENACFVELGAGKGHLSYYLSKAVQHVTKCSVLLVDRASHRHKQDNKVREDSAVTVERIRADISDLVLSKVSNVQNSQTLVAVSKHLCGVATDLALNCVTRSDVIEKTSGLVMATCCHHRCVWESYVGRPFLEEHNVTRPQFDVICGLVSWATCGSGLSRERRAEINNSKQPKKAKYEEKSKDAAINNSPDENKDSTLSLNKNVEIKTPKEPLNGEQTDQIYDEDSDSSMDSNDFNDEKETEESTKNEAKITGKRNVSVTKHLGLKFHERQEIGFKAKAILDWGRLLFLRGKKFDVNLSFYVDKCLSPENVCIIAVKNT